MLAGVDWCGLCGDLEGASAFLRELKTIPWFKPDGTVQDGDGIRLFETQKDARHAAWEAVREDAWDLAFDAPKDDEEVAAWNAAKRVARSAARDAACYAARAAAGDAARAAAGDAARSASRVAAWNAAWDAAGDASRAAAWDAAGDAARGAAGDARLYTCVVHVCDGLPIAQKHIDYARKRMDVWRHGYGVLCDVNGVLYCYKRI